MTSWHAKSMSGEWFEVKGPIPRIGDHVTMPGDPMHSTVIRVHHQVIQDFHNSKGCETRVTVVME